MRLESFILLGEMKYPDKAFPGAPTALLDDKKSIYQM
jgi:hypothetical protein